MTMTLTRPLASIDLETTGVDPVEDRIVSFGVTVLHPDNSRTQFQQMFNPGIPIKPEATSVHGITDAMVADKPPFKDFAAKIHRGLIGKDLLGYNLRSLDLPMLDEELRRCGLALDLTGVTIIDSFGIFCKKEPRDLSAAVMKYTGRDHNGAHNALSDSEVTLAVLVGQMLMYGIEDLAAAAVLSRRDDFEIVDLAGKLYRDADGDVRFAFGKQRGKKVREEIGFASWMLSKDFPGSTKDAIRREFDRLEEGGVQW
jgi:DNA polymerase-3 subunit epsilon